MFRKTALPLAVLTVLLLAGASTARAQQTGPVVHLDGAGLFFSVDDPESGLRLVVLFEGNPGDFLRFRPDGKVALEFQTNNALLLLLDPATGTILLGGPGSATLSEIDVCDFDAGICFPTGERTVLHVQGELAPAPDAPPVADVTVQQVVVKGDEKLFRFEIVP